MGTRPAGLVASASLAIGLLGASAVGAIDIVGKTEVTLGWTPASGPVAGYYVIVSRDGASSEVEGMTGEPQETVRGEYGETLVVQVAAFDANGVSGPMSPPSSPLTFVPADPGGGSTGGGGGSGGSEPVPGEDAAPSAPADHTGDGISDLLVRSGRDLSLWAIDGSHVIDGGDLPAAPEGADVVGDGDYDGNGVADLVWENATSGALTLWLFDGGGVMASGLFDRAGPAPEDSWHVGGSADFDGDGRDELLLFSRVLGEVETWSFDGAAVSRRTRGRGRVGAWSVAATADVDGDERAETLWLNERYRALELDRGGSRVPVATLDAGWTVAGTGDFDGDGGSELLLRHAVSGALEAWTIDASGQVSATHALAPPETLPLTLGTGGDFDANGMEDLVRSDPASGTVTLWLSTSQGIVKTALDRALPEGAQIVSGASGSDSTTFYQRFCGGDFDGSGVVDLDDFSLLAACARGYRADYCEWADMDSDGSITTTDVSIFRDRYSGLSCELLPL